MLCNGITNAGTTWQKKMVIVYRDRLLLAHAANFVKLTFMVVKIFSVMLFCAPRLLRPGATAPSASL